MLKEISFLQGVVMSEEMADITLSGNKVLPPKNDKIALIDADTIVFASSTSCEYCGDLLPREMYTDEEWLLITQDPGYDEENHVMYGINLEQAIEHSLDKLNRIMEMSGCKDFQLHFTVGRESFRYTKVDVEYKANRQIDSQGEKTRAPFGLHEIKQELCRRYPLKTKMWYECEADDAVWWLGDKYPEKYIVHAVDKDVLGATKAEAFNYLERKAYTHPKSGNLIEAIDMQFVKSEAPEIFWYKQCLTGDVGDGIIGIKGIGPVKANKILLGCTTDAERWDAIVAAYEKANRTMLDALLNMRMVRLDQYNPETNELKLFDPRDLV
jgi:hypothetical protein